MSGIVNSYIKKIKRIFIKEERIMYDSVYNNQNYVEQSGVIPYIIEKGNIQIILIKSRSGKKWILPKGFIDEGLTPSESALKEAFEEAGVTGTVSSKPAGFYKYTRQMKEYKVSLFPMKTEVINDEWPESSERERKLVNLESVDYYINDPGIREVIGSYFSSDMFKKKTYED